MIAPPNHDAPPGAERLLHRNFPHDLLPGARNALTTCLRVQPGERVAVICDEGSLNIGAALVEALREKGATPVPMVIESAARRPTLKAPESIIAHFSTCTAGIYTVTPQEGELGSRADIISIVERRRMRYAHMVGITEQCMKMGMLADYNEVHRLSQKLKEKCSQCREIHVRTPGGTDITARFDPKLKWIATDGIIHEGLWHNLPAGQVYSAPVDAWGTFVCDATLGDYFTTRYGDLQRTPLRLELKNQRVISAECENRALRDDFWRYVHTDPNSNKLGEFALGTNVALREYIGVLLQDEKVPTLHIAFGKPYASQTGADWDSTTHVDLITRDTTAWIDGELILENLTYKI